MNEDEEFGKPISNLYGSNQIFKTDKSLTILPENEEEERLLEEIEKTVKEKFRRLKREGYNVINNFELNDSPNKVRLKVALEDFYEYLENTHKDNNKYLIKWRQINELLLMFFGSNKDIRQINQKDANEFMSFLLKIPKDYKNKPDLKGKDIKTLILKKSKLLNSYDTLALSSVDEHIKKCKQIFNRFEENLLIIKNPFNFIKKQSTSKSQVNTLWLPFKENKLKEILKGVNNKNLTEEYNFMTTLLYTGMRREEIALLRLNNIKLSEMYIDIDFDIDKVKTENSKRIIPIHKDLLTIILEQMKNKQENDFLFFNVQKFGKQWKEHRRGENIGTNINKIIGEYVKENKNQYVLHSFRKNFIQEIVLSGEFENEIDYSTIIGHSTGSNVTDKHYLLGKRNYKLYKEKIDKIDFSKYF